MGQRGVGCFAGHFIRYLGFFECARRFQLCLCESAMRETKHKLAMRVTAASPLSGGSGQFVLSFLQLLRTLLYRRYYSPFPSGCARINGRVFESETRANFGDRKTLDFACVFNVF